MFLYPSDLFLSCCLFCAPFLCLATLAALIESLSIIGISVRSQSDMVPSVPPPSPELGSPPRQSLPPFHPTDGPFRGLVGNQFKLHMIKGCGEGTHVDEHYIKRDNEKGDVSECAVEDGSSSESLSDEQQEWTSESSTTGDDDDSLDARAGDRLSIGHKQRFQHVDSRSNLTKMVALSKLPTLPPDSHSIAESPERGLPSTTLLDANNAQPCPILTDLRKIRLDVLVQECEELLKDMLWEHQDKRTTVNAVKKRGSGATGVSQRLESNAEESNLWNLNLDRDPCEDYHERGW
jgi:hypothetical protein